MHAAYIRGNQYQAQQPVNCLRNTDVAVIELGAGVENDPEGDGIQF